MLTQTTNEIMYQGGGGSVGFPIPFPFLENEQIEAIVRDNDGTETRLRLGTNYTVAKNAENGSLTLLTGAPTATETLIVRRIMPLTQETTLHDQGPMFPRTMEKSLDKLTMIAQQLQSGLDGKLSLPHGMTEAKTQEILGGAQAEHAAIRGDLAALRQSVATKVGVDDPLLAQPRTPTAHAKSHAAGGVDAVTPASIGCLPKPAVAGKQFLATSTGWEEHRDSGGGTGGGGSWEDIPLATATSDGLMSAADKARIVDALRDDGIRADKITDGVAEATVADIAAAISREPANPPNITVHVAPGGNDNASGTASDPFATPGGALNAVRNRNRGYLSYVRINVAAGSYTGNLVLSQLDPAAYIGTLDLIGAGSSSTRLSITQPVVLNPSSVGVATINGIHFISSHRTAETGIFTPNNVVLNIADICFERTPETEDSSAAIWVGPRAMVVMGGGITFKGTYYWVLYCNYGNLRVTSSSNRYTFTAGKCAIVLALNGGVARAHFANALPLYESGWTTTGNVLSAVNGGWITTTSQATMSAWINGGNAVADKDPSFIAFVTNWKNT